MTQPFYMKLTAAGLAAYAAAAVSEEPIVVADIVIGDGDGAVVEPTGAETALYNQVAVLTVTDKVVDEDHPTWAIFKTLIPAETGGFTIREVGFRDGEGVLLAIGKYPEQYKPLAADGFAEDLTLELAVAVANADLLVISESSVVLASQAFVRTELARRLTWFRRAR